MSTNLAEEFRRSGIQAGDVVEMATFPDSLSVSLSEALGEKVPLMEGYLAEVTAIGEGAILGFVLHGDPINLPEVRKEYGLLVWSRSDYRETIFSGRKVFRKVGRKNGAGYELLYPDLVNIYSRCQGE